MGGPEMAPHTPQTLGAPRRSRGTPRYSDRLLIGRAEAQPAALAHDHAGTREVRGEDQRAAVCVALDELAARLGGLLAVVTEAARPLRLGPLNHAMHEVAGEDGVARPGRGPPRDVVRRVADRRLEREPAVQPLGVGD